MNEYILERVKNSLNKQHYLMNDSWLSDCIEYYLNDHRDAPQNEIINFVTNQWLLQDLREINNEKGSLPKNLAKHKSITLPGKYILQMEKIYDISTSKYKQLEKIRNISSDNIETTEKENKTQEEKFQNWEPKSKRMLQLFLTDGAQDIIAIEYKTIRFLKDDLYPGFKLMIKGPVVCRRGVILLQENNILEVGGEVDDLLICNALENVFARALNMEENPDPYNDKKNIRNNINTQNSHSIQGTIDLEDDFEIDSEALDQIEREIETQNTIANTNVSAPVKRAEQIITPTFSNNSSNLLGQSAFNTSISRSFATPISGQFNCDSSSSNCQNKMQTQRNKYNIQDRVTDREDDNSLIELGDDQMFENVPTPDCISSVPSPCVNKKQTSLLKYFKNQNINDFPSEEEMYDLNEQSSLFFKKSKPQNEIPGRNINLFTKDSIRPSTKENAKSTACKSKNPEPTYTSSKSSLSYSPNETTSKSLSRKLSESIKSKNISKPSTSNFSNFQDDDMEIEDFAVRIDENKYCFDKFDNSQTNSYKSSQGSSNSLSKLNPNVNMNDFICNAKEDSSELCYESKFSGRNSSPLVENEFDDRIVTQMGLDNVLSTNDQLENKAGKQQIEKVRPTKVIPHDECASTSSLESTGFKRLACTSSDTNARQKIRCLESSPKDKTTNDKKVSDFQTLPSLLDPNIPRMCELMYEVLEQPFPDEATQTVVRGKVINIVKLELFKNENGSYFYLEGTITDYTAKMDIVFSSRVLEKIIGYTTMEFSQKRRQSKTNSTIKDQLREDLRRAQQTLKVMDVLMEIELKKNEKILVLNTAEMTKEQKKFMDNRVEPFRK